MQIRTFYTFPVGTKENRLILIIGTEVNFGAKVAEAGAEKAAGTFIVWNQSCERRIKLFIF